MEALARCDSAFRTWYLKGDSYQGALENRIDPQRLEDIFVHNVNRRDIDGEAMPELGHSFSAWNGIDASMSVRCGAWNVSETLRFPNSCILHLPSNQEDGTRMLRHSVLLEILDLMVKSFSPQLAVVNSHPHPTGLVSGAPCLAGWLTYLPFPTSDLPKLPSSAVLRANEMGTVIIADAEIALTRDDPYPKTIGEIQEAVASLKTFQP